jgi:ATP-dependent RNA helicase MSS116
MQRVHVVVLDEADRLLDSGFLRDIKVILGALNPHHRTLLFTATVPEGVAEIAKAYMRPDFVYVDTTIGASPSPRTKVIHEYAVVPPSHIFATLAHAVVKHRRSDTAHKIIVFFNTAWMAHFAAKLFQSLGMHDVMETHSRLSQSQRNAVAAKFAQGRGVVIFASDVIARGIDFPDVTFVVQVGLTDPTQYEHRIGRTGRAGKTGRGLLIIGDDEKVILEKLGKFSMKEMPGSAPGLAVKTLDKELNNAANKAFSASLGFYAANTRVLKWTPQALVNAVKARFASMGLPKPDPIPANRLAKMHLKGAGLE